MYLYKIFRIYTIRCIVADDRVYVTVHYHSFSKNYHNVSLISVSRVPKGFPEFEKRGGY